MAKTDWTDGGLLGGRGVTRLGEWLKKYRTLVAKPTRSGCGGNVFLCIVSGARSQFDIISTG